MRDILRFLGFAILVVLGICVGVIVVAVAAVVGIILHLALFAAPFIMVAVLTIRDWWVYRATQKK